MAFMVKMTICKRPFIVSGIFSHGIVVVVVVVAAAAVDL